jgi:hypothetical protein
LICSILFWTNHLAHDITSLFFFFCGTEFRASHLLGRHLTTWTTQSALSKFNIVYISLISWCLLEYLTGEVTELPLLVQGLQFDLYSFSVEVTKRSHSRNFFCLFVAFFFWCYWGLNLGLCTCKSGALTAWAVSLALFALVILEITHFLPRSAKIMILLF